MNRLSCTAMAMVCGLALSFGAIAQTLSLDQYKARKNGVAAEFRLAQAACARLAGNAKDICQTAASGKERVAKAELRAGYKPSAVASHKLRVAREDAGYSVARERCDALAGDARSTCVRDAMSYFGKS